MRILHTSDWHIGKSLGKFSRFQEQEEFLTELIEIADSSDVDAVVVSGDLFDNYNPSNASLELFYKMLKGLTREGMRPVIAIAGNHDSPDKIEAPDPLARECGIIFAGYPSSRVKPFSLESGLKVLRSDEGFIELALPKYDYPLRVILTPYANEYRLKTYLGISDEIGELREELKRRWAEIGERYCDEAGVNILLAHLLFMKKSGKIPVESDDERSIIIGGAEPIYTECVPEVVQYTALGHLHSKQVVSEENGPIIYSGSPLEYSINETRQDKYVVLVDLEPGGRADYSFVELKSGRKVVRKRFESIDEAEEWLKENGDCLVELTIVTDEFIKSDDKSRLYKAHKGILTVIPEITGDEKDFKIKKIDLDKNISQLFKDYFEYEQGQKPGESLLELFNEIINLESE